jgi:hypothetical protein
LLFLDLVRGDAEQLRQMVRDNVALTHNGRLCLICGTQIKSNMKRHFLDKHFDDGLIYKCPVCQKTYRTRNSFSVHVSNYHKEWKGLDINQCALQKE